MCITEPEFKHTTINYKTKTGPELIILKFRRGGNFLDDRKKVRKSLVHNLTNNNLSLWSNL